MSDTAMTLQAEWDQRTASERDALLGDEELFNQVLDLLKFLEDATPHTLRNQPDAVLKNIINAAHNHVAGLLLSVANAMDE